MNSDVIKVGQVYFDRVTDQYCLVYNIDYSYIYTIIYLKGSGKCRYPHGMFRHDCELVDNI